MDQQEFWDDYQHLKKEATKLRGSENRLKEIRARYLAVRDASHDLILVVDRDLTLLDLNPSGSELLGVSMDAIGKPFAEALAQVSPSAISSLLKNAIQSGKAQAGSWKVPRVNGPALDLKVDVVAVIDDTNRPVGAVLLGHDISLLKTLDLRLAEMGKEIETLQAQVQKALKGNT